MEDDGVMKVNLRRICIVGDGGRNLTVNGEYRR